VILIIIKIVWRKLGKYDVKEISGFNDDFQFAGDRRAFVHYRCRRAEANGGKEAATAAVTTIRSGKASTAGSNANEMIAGGNAELKFFGK
jgi:hypothetical protein